MKNALIILLTLVSIAVFGQGTPSKYYKGSKVTRTDASDTTIIGARYINTAASGKAGVQMIDVTDTAEIFYSGDTLTLFSQGDMYFLSDSASIMMMETSYNDTSQGFLGMLRDPAFGGIFGHRMILKVSRASDTLNSGYLTINNGIGLTGFATPAVLIIAEKEDKFKTTQTQSPFTSKEIGFDATAGPDWEAGHLYRISTDGATASPQISVGIDNYEITPNIIEGFYQVTESGGVLINWQDSLKIITGEQESAIQMILFNQKATVKYKNTDGRSLTETNSGPLLNVEGYFKTSEVDGDCNGCAANGVSIPAKWLDADTLTGSLTAINISPVDSAGVVTDVRGVHVTGLDTLSVTATGARVTRFTGFEFGNGSQEIGADTAYGFRMQQLDHTKSSAIYGLYLYDNLANNIIRSTLILGDGNQTSADVSLELTATDKAFLFNRLTEAQRDALTGVNGMAIYNTDDNHFDVYQSGAWRALTGSPTYKSYSFVSRDAASGTNYVGGFYDFSTTDANLTQISLTVTEGTANNPYGAHAFAVAAAAGVTDGTDLILTVTGTSITDAGVRTGSDSEVIVADGTASATNQYYETSKKWIGQVTYTLSSTGGTAFNYDFNYGLAKYDDFANSLFTVTEFEVTGLANSNDAGFNIEVCHHQSAGWTYAATGFSAGSTSGLIGNMNADYVTETDAKAGSQLAYKRTGLSTSVDGTASEGILFRITTSVNNSISFLNCHIGVIIE